MNWLAKILGWQKDEPKPIDLPKIGERWILDREDGSPWAKPNDYPHVEVFDVKDGWVRYEFGGGGSLFQDERMKASMFVKVYKRCA